MKHFVSLRASAQCEKKGGAVGVSARSIWRLRRVAPLGAAFETVQACIHSPLLGRHIILCQRPKQRCHLTILSEICIKYIKHAELYENGEAPPRVRC